MARNTNITLLMRIYTVEVDGSRYGCILTIMININDENDTCGLHATRITHSM